PLGQRNVSPGLPAEEWISRATAPSNLESCSRLFAFPGDSERSLRGPLQIIPMAGERAVSLASQSDVQLVAAEPLFKIRNRQVDGLEVALRFSREIDAVPCPIPSRP